VLAEAHAPRAQATPERDELVERHLGLARRLARRFAHGPDTLDDLYQVACVGLVKAVDRFEPERGVSFTSFAVPTILGELRRYLRDTAWPAHVPRPLQERVREMRAAAAQLSARTGRVPTARAVAAYVGCDAEDIVEALEVTSSLATVSLDAPAAGDASDSQAPADRLGAEDPGFERVECLAAIEQALPRLTLVQRQALRLHFGEDLSCRQIARRLGVSRSEAVRDLRSAVTTLRQLQAA
jgi:RNA polymerase sigma-B factor